MERLSELGLTYPDKTGSVVYYDIEYYGTNTTCRNAVNAFMNGWISQLHVRGNLAGVYGSTLCNTGLSDFLNIANVPDVVWPARWYHDLGKGYYDPTATVWNLGSCISNTVWADHQRIRQYEGDHNETWGNLTLGIDSNVLDGAVAIPFLDPTKVSFQEVAGGLRDPVFITHAGDGSGRIFVVERSGRIRIVRNGVLSSTPFVDIQSLVKSTNAEQGLLGLAFHPSYGSNGKFYVVYTAPRAGESHGSVLTLRQYAVSAGNPDIADPNSGTNILTIDHPTYSNHNGGTIAFGNDGYLYWSTGDGGGGGDPNNNAQNLTSLLGKILRIDINSGSSYVIPVSNPFYDSTVPGIKKEIWSYGLRNPWRISFDRVTHDLYIGDVGQSAREEVDFQSSDSTGGENYGWRVMEGSLCYNPSSGCDQTGKVLPVAEYDHTLGCAITGGHVYRGSSFPSLKGYYLYGDYCSGRLFSLSNNLSADWSTPSQIADTNYVISTFGEDENGELYLADYSTGKIYKIQYEELTISGNAGAEGVTLTYMDGTNETITSEADGSYSLPVSYGWSGTVTPSHACYTFSPTSKIYNNVTANHTAQNFIPTFDNSSGCANVDVSIGGGLEGNYAIPVGAQERVEYDLNDGPVVVGSTNTVPIIAALRDAWKQPNETVTSFSQLMGLPYEQLSDTYYFPAYNNRSLSGQLRFGNVDTVGTWVRVEIAGVEVGRYWLEPDAQKRVEYDLNDGPVIVESETEGVKIIAALRDAWKQPDGTVTSFVQLMGLPLEQLSDTYYFPAYNNRSLSGQLRFGNVDTVGTWVRVEIAGVEVGRYWLEPDAQERVEYDLNDGPVIVESETADVKIIAALRDAWKQPDGTVTSFSQLMGLPYEKLSDTYYFPAYNNRSL